MKTSRKHTIAIIIAVISSVAILVTGVILISYWNTPIAKAESRTMQAIALQEDGSAEPCTVLISGISYHYLFRNHADSCALSYYPALNRYEGVASGELVYVPIDSSETSGDLCLFCAKQAYHQYPVLRELVRNIQAAAGQFLRQVEAPRAEKKDGAPC